jgi:hypothetical protein
VVGPLTCRHAYLESTSARLFRVEQVAAGRAPGRLRLIDIPNLLNRVQSTC